MASLLNPPSTPTTSKKVSPRSCITSTNLQNTGADSSSFESENSKTGSNDIDLSWLPNYDDNGSASESVNPSHESGQNDFDDSWLPNYNDIKRKSSTTSKFFNSNRFRKPENDSWLPSTPTVKNGNKNNVHDSWLPNYNDTKRNSSKTTSKSNNLNCSKKTSHSWFPSTHIVNDGNKNNESISKNNNKHNNSRNHNRVEGARGERKFQHANLLKKKAECSVETDSLGGVSTLLRRWMDLAETTNSNNNKTISPKSGSVSAERNNKNPLGSPSWKVNDASDRCASPTTTNDSFVDSESCKTSPSTLLSCLTSRVIKDSKAINAENDKSLVMDIINKLSREEELAAGNTNESFTRIRNTSDHQQVAEENRYLSHAIGSARFTRHRQAFKDFLNLMEQNKRHELKSLSQSKPVTEFSYRRRIKALLRFRFISLEAEPETEAESITTTNNQSEVHHQITESTSPCKDIDSSSHDSIQSKQDSNPEFHVHNRAEYNKELDDEDEEGIGHMQALENSCHNWIISEWDEEEEEEEEESYDMHDWISEIARPRSEWECMRQARYQEMLHLFSNNRDIQELLKRRCVSSFRSCDHLRGKIDQLMMSRAQGHLHPGGVDEEQVGGREWMKEEAMEGEEEDEDEDG